jgi:hypothetical protein
MTIDSNLLAHSPSVAPLTNVPRAPPILDSSISNHLPPLPPSHRPFNFTEDFIPPLRASKNSIDLGHVNISTPNSPQSPSNRKNQIDSKVKKEDLEICVDHIVSLLSKVVRQQHILRLEARDFLWPQEATNLRALGVKQLTLWNATFPEVYDASSSGMPNNTSTPQMYQSPGRAESQLHSVSIQKQMTSPLELSPRHIGLGSIGAQASVQQTGYWDKRALRFGKLPAYQEQQDSFLPFGDSRPPLAIQHPEAPVHIGRPAPEQQREQSKASDSLHQISPSNYSSDEGKSAPNVLQPDDQSNYTQAEKSTPAQQKRLRYDPSRDLILHLI